MKVAGAASVQGMCATISEVRTGGVAIDAPYPCDVTTAGGCEYMLQRLGVNQGSRNGVCECALTGGDDGYCKIPGDFEIKAYAQARRFMASKSAFCHTWERHSIQHNADCTIAEYEELKESYETIYEFENWPFIQASSQIKECYDNFNPMSQYNIRFSQRAFASGLSFGAIAFMMLAVLNLSLIHI